MTPPAPKPSVRVIEELRAEIAHRQELWPHENMMPMNIHRLKALLAVAEAAKKADNDKAWLTGGEMCAIPEVRMHDLSQSLSALDATGGGL